MFQAPFMLLVNGEATWFDHARDAAQHWADELDAQVFDANNIEIPAFILEDLLR